MRASTIVALAAPLVLASPLSTPNTSLELITLTPRAEAAAAWQCSVPYNYCGWYLISQDSGWNGVLNPNGLYQCVSGGVNLLAVCSKGCAGPTAHCA